MKRHRGQHHLIIHDPQHASRYGPNLLSPRSRKSKVTSTRLAGSLNARKTDSLDPGPAVSKRGHEGTSKLNEAALRVSYGGNRSQDEPLVRAIF